MLGTLTYYVLFNPHSNLWSGSHSSHYRCEETEVPGAEELVVNSVAPDPTVFPRCHAMSTLRPLLYSLAEETPSWMGCELRDLLMNDSGILPHRVNLFQGMWDSRTGVRKQGRTLKDW